MMFVCSLKTSKKKLILCGVVVLLIVVAAFFLFGRSDSKLFAVSPSGKYSLSAKDNAARIAFLSQFGWKVHEEPVEISEVVIPAEFNQTYEEYNEIQKQQGLDLSDYKEQTCKRISYEVCNYPGHTTGIRANLLLYDGRVVGGDISAVELGGFMHGFVPPNGMQLEDKPVTTFSVKPGATKERMTRSTERETLAPDPAMPEAPTD